MLTVILTLAAVALALVALLWTGTLLAQGYFYDSPTDGLAWRAPAGAGVLTLFLLIWCMIEYSSPNSTDALHRFSSERITEVHKFWSVRRSESGEEKEIPYERRSVGPNQTEFVDENGGRWARSKSGMMIALIVEEKTGDEKKRTRFNAEMKDGKFAEREARGIKQPLRYVEENGDRYIVETNLNHIIGRRSGKLIGNLFINLVHFGLCFAVMWPLLRFQWAHALGFAFVCWLVTTLALVPFLVDKSRSAAEKKPAERKATAALVIPFAARPRC
jgi:hypothetical protein